MRGPDTQDGTFARDVCAERTRPRDSERRCGENGKRTKRDIQWGALMANGDMLFNTIDHLMVISFS